MTAQSNGPVERASTPEPERRKENDGAPDEVPGAEGPNRGSRVRKLGLGAAAGAGVVAAAGLLGAGERENGSFAPHASPSPPTAPARGDSGQGNTPLTVTDGSTDPSSPLDGNSGQEQGTLPPAAPPDVVSSPSADPGVNLTDGSTGTPDRHPASDPVVPATGGEDPQSAPQVWSGPDQQAPDPNGEMWSIDHADPSTGEHSSGWPAQGNEGSASTAEVPLYDSSGAPVGALDSNGHFTPLGGNSPDPGASSPQVLYDGAGRPTALMKDSGDVTPLPADSQEPLVGTDGSFDGSSKTDSLVTDGSFGDTQNNGSQNTFANYSGQPNDQGTDGANTAQSGYDVASMTDEQKFVYAPWALSDDAKSQIVQDVLSKNNAELPPGISQYLPELGDDFFSQDTYQLTDSDNKKIDANLLSVAATAYAMAGEVAADILEQTQLAKDLESVADAISSDWVAKIMNIDVSSVFDGDVDLDDFKMKFDSLYDGQKQATRNVIDAIYDMGDGLKKTASAYFATEQANLKQFKLTAKDPRPPEDQRRYVNGEDKYEYYKTKMRNLEESME
ncbi:hypothetical protein OG417_53830 [Actinoallomurus sp. NBC_01490]|uniref:hypothetical protein n=1 Tax=Actinoallomurus sp. NBC_01490 TaxID=2903557 RepID=UPI002E352FE8|nr:hypothetical protein [Actinoallomurus sp. NBC_01490]